MARRYVMPKGALVDSNGTPNLQGRSYLEFIQKISSAVNDVTDLDNMTTYSADALRDKIIELMSALKG